MNRQGSGFFWFAINNQQVDYAELSCRLANSIRSSGTVGEIAVACDSKTKINLQKCEAIDYVIEIPHCVELLSQPNFLNEWQAFYLSPFLHTMKLESDMLFVSDLSWWWHLLRQHDLVFSHDCLDIAEHAVKDKKHRRLFLQNSLPNVYNGLTYFRYSELASKFYKLCRQLIENWQHVKENILTNCHDRFPSTDVVYALAKKILDPLECNTIKYAFFRMIHFKPHINQTEHSALLDKFITVLDDQKIIIGGQAIYKPLHYHDKNFNEKIYHAK